MKKPIIIFGIVIAISSAMLGCSALRSNSDNASADSPTGEADWSRIAVWERLINEGGCLTGSQNYRDGQYGEGSVFSQSAEWQRLLTSTDPGFFEQLLNRMNSAGQTYHHVCPWQNATEGEMAVYTLQHITKTNWHEYDGPDKSVKLAAYTLNTTTGENYTSERSSQALLRGILDDPQQRNSLRSFFRFKFESLYPKNKPAAAWGG